MGADGSWKITINTPLGARTSTVTLATHGNALTGTAEGDDGVQQIEDGVVDGDSLRWTVNITSPVPMKLVFTGTVAGDDISGTVALGAFGNASFQGSRV